jgi:hypothetical protein
MVGAERGQRDRQIVGRAILKFRLVLQGGKRAGPFVGTEECVVYDFALAFALGIGAFDKTKNVARVDTSLAAFATKAVSAATVLAAPSTLSAFAAFSPRA